MATAYIYSKHNARPASRRTKAFALSAVLSVVGVGLFAVTASAIGGGPLDTSFDSDGILSTSFGGYDFGYAVAIQPDGKIVVAGTSDVNGNDDFALSRYNTNGTLDTSFDSDGKLTTDFGATDNGLSVAIQADGKIVVAGWSDSQNSNFALARYNSNGSLDTSFDTDGKLTTDFGGRDFGKSVAIQADGKIIVAGYSEVSPVVDFALARYNTNGSLDTSFDTDGKLTTNFGENGNRGKSVAIQADGKIVVAGSSSVNNVSEFALARYNTNGALDTSFDTDGKLTTNFGSDTEGYSVAIQRDGKIVVAGDNNASSSYKFALARYNTNGSLDTSFDSDGKLTTDIGDNYNSDGVSVAIQPDEKIVVAGPSKANNVTDYGLARYNTDGALDTSFDTDGKLTTDFGGSDEAGFSVAIQPDGKIVAAGYSDVDTYSFALARYNAPPTVTLNAVSTTSSSQTTIFTISGNQDIDCTTLSTTIGQDFMSTNISAITAIAQTSPAVCTITATSTAIANGVAVISTLQAATSFSITGTNNYIQTTLTSAPQSVTVTIANSTPTTSVPTATTTPSSTVAPSTVNPPSNETVKSLSIANIVVSGTVIAGSSVTVEASGFNPGETVSVGILGEPATTKSTATNSQGAITTKLSIPTRATGKLTVYAYGQTSRRGYREIVDIGPSKELPVTGRETNDLALWAFAFIVTGLVPLYRRRLLPND